MLITESSEIDCQHKQTLTASDYHSGTTEDEEDEDSRG